MTRLNASKNEKYLKCIQTDKQDANEIRLYDLWRISIYLVDNMFNFYDIDIIIGAHSNTEYLSIEWVNSKNWRLIL